MAELGALLEATVATNASDLYLLEGAPPTLRIDGTTRPVPGEPPLGSSEMQRFLFLLVPEAQRKGFEASSEANLSHVHPEFGRFRLSCYRAMGAIGIVLRRVKTIIPTLEELGLPDRLARLAMERQGLILVVGATGVGKSTTVAAMLDHRNGTAPGHILTVEDPVEFIHTGKQSLVSQREVGIDTESYLVGLQNGLRQAPDVVFVGELREPEAVAVALHAAETGHLVLSTLHATNSTTAIERLVHFFPASARDAVLLQLSLLLRAVIGQRLVPRAGGSGRLAAIEVMLQTARIQALIRRGELESLRTAVEEGVQEGLQTFDQALLTLFQEKKISAEDALRFADVPNTLRLRIKGLR